MSYIGEFGVNWRALLAACIGMSTGYTVNNYVNNIFIPELISEFGWTNSQIALVGVTVIIAVLCQPVAGRVTDRIGPRAVAIFGIVAGPLIYLAMSALRGSFEMYLLLSAAQVAFVAATTAAVVYTRIVASSFDRALGLALAVVTCSPPVLGALIVPPLSALIDEHGWRAGYWAMALFVGAGGALALTLVPRAAPLPALPPARGAPSDGLRDLAGSKALRLIIIGMLLCNLTVMMQTTQLKVIVLRAGASPEVATLLLSIYALGVMSGRLLCGLALDRFAAYLVTAIAMALPGAGLLILASGTALTSLLAAAVLLLGASIGAEGDLAAYLVRRYFPAHTYGTALGLIMGAIALAGAAGALILSATLSATDDYRPFLLGGAGAALCGAIAFAGLRTIRPISG